MKENVKESANGDVTVTETVLNTVVVLMDAAMLLDLPQNNAIMNPDIHLTTFLAVMIQKTIWMWIDALPCALTIAVHVHLSMIGGRLLMTVNPVVWWLMTAIVQRESLAQFIVLKIVLFDLRFHPMTVIAWLKTDLLAFLLLMWHVQRMLIVPDLLKREYLNNQSLPSKNVSASLWLPEWKTALPTNRV